MIRRVRWWVVCLVLGAMLVATAVPVAAQEMTLEASTTWKEDGDTRVHGVFVGDAGGSSGPEVVTAGEAVTDASGTVKAQLRVYEHSGSALTLKDNALWQNASNDETVWTGVTVADIGGSSDPEIVVVGFTSDGGEDPMPLAKVWTYDGSRLSAGDTWTVNDHGVFLTVAVGDADGSPGVEIVAGGYLFEPIAGGDHLAYLVVFAYDGSALSDTAEWADNGGDSIIYSATIVNLDGGSDIEIVTAGYNRTGTWDPKWANVTAWTYSGSAITEKDGSVWQWNKGRDTVFHGVAVANVDDDVSGELEVVACGTGRDIGGTEDRGLVRIYDDGLNGLKHKDWDSGDETVCRSVHVADLDGDDPLEISAGGWALISNTYNGEIRTWYWEGGSNDIEEEQNSPTQWYTTGNTKVNSVYSAQADADDPTEVASGGQAHDGTHDKGELRVYHL